MFSSYFKFKTPIDFIVLATIITAIEVILTITNILLPLSSNSPEHIIFSLMRLIILLWLGWALRENKLKNIAIDGALVALASMIIISIGTAIGYYAHTPLLGINVPSAWYIIPVLVSSAILNIVIGAILAVAGAVIARKIRKKKTLIKLRTRRKIKAKSVRHKSIATRKRKRG